MEKYLRSVLRVVLCLISSSSSLLVEQAQNRLGYFAVCVHAMTSAKTL